MGFLSSLFGKPVGPAGKGSAQRLVGAECRRSISVVGEFYHRDAAANAVRKMSGGECLASLEAEPTNPRDPLAVKVLMFGKIVGYLSREQAVEYGPAVALAVQHGEFITVRAHGRSWAGEFSEGDDLLLYLPTMKSLMRELQLAYSE